MVYNILTCAGWDTAARAGWLAFGGCTGARFGAVILFFIIAMLRKWGGEEIGFEFNFWTALGLGLIGYLIAITLSGNVKIAFGVGLIGSVVGGYLAGAFFGGTE